MSLKPVLFLTISLTIIHQFSSVASQDLFRDDYKFVEIINLYIKGHNIKNNWVNAVAICKAEGAKLFVPKSDFDVRTVLTTVGNQNTQFWVGIHDMFSEGQFTTINGERISEGYNTWYPDYPDDIYGKQNCVALAERGIINALCDSNKKFICIKEATSNSSRNLVCDTYDPAYTYNEEADRCYKLHVNAMNWRDAFRTCQCEQAHLAVINCLSEANILMGLINRYPADILYGNFHKTLIHLGFNNLFNERQFMTIDGQTLRDAGYDVWAIGQPDNFAGSEHCGSMYRDGTLNDLNCDTISAMFVCEKPLGNPNAVEKLSRFGQ